MTPVPSVNLANINTAEEQKEYDSKLFLMINKINMLTDEALLNCLKEYEFASTLELKGESKFELTDGVFNEIGTIAKSIRVLILHDGFNAQESLPVTNEALGSIVASNPQLNCLDLYGCPILTPEGLIRISQKVHALTDCKLSSKYWLTDAVIKAFLTNHPELESLELGFECHRLENGTLTDKAARDIQDHKNLRKLHLTSLPFSKPTLRETLAKMNQLQALLLWDKLENQDIAIIARNMPELRECNLKIWKVTSLSVLKEFRNCPNLESLTLEITSKKILGIKRFSEDSVFAYIKKHLPKLQIIKVNSKR